MCGIRINAVEKEIDSDQYKFDCEEQPEFFEKNTADLPTIGKDADLLGLGTGICLLKCLIFGYF